MVMWSLSPVTGELQFSECLLIISLEINAAILEGEIQLSWRAGNSFEKPSFLSSKSISTNITPF